MVNSLCGFLEIAVRAFVDINEFLRIPVNQGKPGILYLDHNTVSLFECMGNIRKLIFNFGNFPGDKRFRFFKAVAVPAPENLCL